MKIALALTPLFAFATLPTMAAPISSSAPPQVYPGCAVPPTTFNHVWYFDPAKGNSPAGYAAMTPPIPMPAPGQGPAPSTQGSAQHPWNDLSALDWSDNNRKAGYTYPLLSSVPTYQLNAAHTHYGFFTGSQPGEVQQAGPVQPGDEVLLMSGNYGALVFSLPGIEVVNKAFVTIAAAPGQTPVIGSLVIADTNAWAFYGIKFQHNPSAWMTNIGDGGGAPDGDGNALTTHDLVFNHLDYSSADPAVYGAWTQAQWATNPGNSFVVKGSNLGQNTYCISLTGSHLHAVYNGPVVASTRSLIAGNEVDHFLDNAIGYAGSNNTFHGNYIHDSVDTGHGLHVDGMQGGAYPLPSGQTGETFTNVVIDGNTVVERADPTNKFPNIMTGMDDYSGVGWLTWDHLQVTNNLFISGGTCILYEQNIVNTLISGNICLPNGYQTGVPPAIALALVGNSNDRICNNIAPSINFVSNQPHVTADHNIASKLIFNSLLANGSYSPTASFFSAPGFYGPAGGPVAQSAAATNEILAPASLLALFTQYASPTAIPPVYNLDLVPGPATLILSHPDCLLPS